LAPSGYAPAYKINGSLAKYDSAVSAAFVTKSVGRRFLCGQVVACESHVFNLVIWMSGNV